MAPRKATMKFPTVTEMLMSKGFDPAEDEVGVVIEVEGHEYIIKMVDGKHIFEEVELEAEDYEAKEVIQVEENVHVVDKTKKKKEKKPKEEAGDKKQKKEKKKEENIVVEENVLEEDAPKEEKEDVLEVDVLEEYVPKEEKEDVVVEEDVLEEEAVLVTEKKVKKERKPKKEKKTTDEEEKEEKLQQDMKPKKERKPKKEKLVSEDEKEKKTRKTRDPSKPKRPREKTCHNNFISLQMFELKKNEPELSGRERFAKANRIWKELDPTKKSELIEMFKADKQIVLQ